MPEESVQVAPARVTSAGDEATGYSLQRIGLDDADDSVLSELRAFHARHSPDSPMHDPEWLRGYFEGQTEDLWCYTLYRGSQLCGTAPFLLRQWPMKWYLGEWPVAEFHLGRLRLLGGPCKFPEDAAAYDLLFRELAAGDVRFDALYLEEVPIDSFLWKYIHRSERVRSSFLLYQPERPLPRPVLRIEGTFEQYMGKFNSKHRNTLNRKIKKLKAGALGEMRLIRYEAPEQVQLFLEKAVEVSRKTYQWSRHGRGLSAVELVRKRLLFAAGRGWMRSYLLFCGGQACAFLLGFQYNGRFLLEEIGFDPELARYSVGTVLQMLTVEDLFLHNRPHIFDLQDYGVYKEALSTESFLQGKLFMFRRGPYGRFLRSGHQACTFMSRSLSSVLEYLNLKSKLKQRLRGWRG